MLRRSALALRGSRRRFSATAEVELRARGASDDAFFSVTVSTQGAAVTSIRAPDGAGALADVVVATSAHERKPRWELAAPNGGESEARSSAVLTLRTEALEARATFSVAELVPEPGPEPGAEGGAPPMSVLALSLRCRPAAATAAAAEAAAAAAVAAEATGNKRAESAGNKSKSESALELEKLEAAFAGLAASLLGRTYLNLSGHRRGMNVATVHTDPCCAVNS